MKFLGRDGGSIQVFRNVSFKKNCLAVFEMSASTSDSDSDAEEAARFAAMASCVMSAAEVLASAPPSKRKPPPPQPKPPRAARGNASDGEDHGDEDDETEDAATTAPPTSHNRLFSKLAGERLHALLAKTFESRLAEGVWGPSGRSKGSSQLRIFPGSSVTQPTLWPPAADVCHGSEQVALDSAARALMTTATASVSAADGAVGCTEATARKAERQALRKAQKKAEKKAQRKAGRKAARKAERQRLDCGVQPVDPAG